MSLYNLTQYDGLRTEDIAQFATELFHDLIQNPSRIGERLLPWVPVEDWKVEVGQVSFRPVASGVIAPDSVLPRGPLGTLSEKAYQILQTGLKYNLKETEIRRLRDIFLSGQRVDPQTLLRTRPYNLAGALVTAYLDRAEDMRMQALSKGQYVIPRSGGIAVDWGMDPSHQITLAGTDVWDDLTNADGLDDLEAFDDLIYQDTGVHSRLTVMPKARFNNLVSQVKTRERLSIAAYAGIGGVLAPQATQQQMRFVLSQVNGYLAERDIGPIVLYDRLFNEFDFEAGNQPTPTRFLDADRFFMVAPTPIDGGVGARLPGASAVGYTADGPVVQNNFNPGLHVWMTEQDEPFEVSVKSVGWVLPIIDDVRTVVNGTLI